MICSLCPRRCGAERTVEAGAGFCHMGTDPVVARAALHFWEEPCISGKNGSGTVFFSGCPMGCVFCQNYEISAERFGRRITVDELSAVFERLEKQGAHNINLVNPTHFVPAILEALRIRKPAVPVVYNSSGYERVETLRLLEGYVDIYLPDLKYKDGQVAARYSGAADYFSYASLAVEEMVRQTGPAVYGADGVLQRGTVIRHLILPGHTRNSIAVLQWLAQQLPQVPVSLMAQYLPCGKASDYPEINRPITKREYHKVLNFLFELGLDGFVQERSSAVKEYIPSFHLEGIEEEKNEE